MCKYFFIINFFKAFEYGDWGWIAKTLSKDNKVKYWKFEENLDDLGNYVYKESLIDEKEFELPNLLYVTGDGRVLLADEKGNLINIE